MIIKIYKNIIMWISRDKNGTLQVSDMIPMKGKSAFFHSRDATVNYLKECLFPEVTFENSPIEVKFMEDENKISNNQE